MNLIDLAYSVPWLMEPGYLDGLLNLAESVYDDRDAHRLVHLEEGKTHTQSPRIKTRGGVAIIPVLGPIFRRANLMTTYCGATSIEALGRDFGVALADPKVHSILLDIDSPGGEANGTEEMASMIRDARSRKPIVAYVGGRGASGAYWIASGASEIVAAKGAFLGSIGAVASYRDDTKKQERLGIKNRQYVYSGSPKKRPDLDSEEGQAQMQAQIDALGDLFVDGVARNRGVDRDHVLKKFGQGDTMIARLAVKAGMADRVGTFEKTLMDLSAAGGRSRTRTKAAATGGAMTLRQMMSAMLGRTAAAEDIDLDADLADDATIKGPTSDPAATVEDPEKVALKKKLAEFEARAKAEFDDRVQAQAEAFVASLKDRIVPAQAAGLADLYIQAALDDRANGGGTRVDALKAFASVIPAHRLTEVFSGEDDLKTLPSGQPSPEGEAAYKATYAALTRPETM
jgi:signal peptide peptidase SppA